MSKAPPWKFVPIIQDVHANCPCGSRRGDYERLLRYADGTIICAACHGHMFHSPTEKPMANPNLQTKEQRAGSRPSVKQLRDKARGQIPK